MLRQLSADEQHRLETLIKLRDPLCGGSGWELEAAIDACASIFTNVDALLKYVLTKETRPRYTEPYIPGDTIADLGRREDDSPDARLS